MDPCKMFDGRLRDGKRNIMIPSQLNLRNNQLDNYINKNFKEMNHEKLLPNILNHKYFGDTKKLNSNNQGKKILNRLNEKI